MLPPYKNYYMGELILQCCQANMPREFSVNEIRKAGIMWIKRVKKSFSEEMHQLMKGHATDGGRLLELSPKLDTDGAMRLGGL